MENMKQQKDIMKSHHSSCHFCSKLSIWSILAQKQHFVYVGVAKNYNKKKNEKIFFYGAITFNIGVDSYKNISID